MTALAQSLSGMVFENRAAFGLVDTNSALPPQPTIEPAPWSPFRMTKPPNVAQRVRFKQHMIYQAGAQKLGPSDRPCSLLVKGCCHEDDQNGSRGGLRGHRIEPAVELAEKGALD